MTMRVDYVNFGETFHVVYFDGQLRMADRNERFISGYYAGFSDGIEEGRLDWGPRFWLAKPTEIPPKTWPHPDFQDAVETD